MTASNKRQTVEELATELQRASAVIVIDHRSLNQSGLTALRARLSLVGGSVRVVKNSLARRAAKDSGQPLLSPLLAGPSALVFAGDDPVATARALNGVRGVRGGVLAGQTLDGGQIGELGSFASTTLLRQGLLGALISPLQGLSNALG